MAGRKKKSKLDLLRTKFWLVNVLRVTDSKNINKLGDKLDPQFVKQSIYKYEIKKQLYKYAKSEAVVSGNTIKLIGRWMDEHGYHLRDHAKLFEIGPYSEVVEDSFAPLWDALGDSISKIQGVLVSYDPAVLVQKYQGISFRLRNSNVIFRIFGEYEPPAYWEDLTKENEVAKRYENNDIDLTIDLIVLTIASWRIAHITGDSIPMMNYVMIGLLHQAIPKFAQQYDIEEELLSFIKELDEQHLKDLEAAVQMLNTTANRYPACLDESTIADEDGKTQPATYDFLIVLIEQSSVSHFITQR